MNKSTPDGQIPKFSPREFLRARRPECFSDSFTEERSSLDRTLLEYHLDTLTSRSQENDFERFARKLASIEICPNLLPQTGPTGGGDGKVDAETYPVDESLSFRWHNADAQGAASERWAFAFSTKKKWRPKLESDIEKIAATKRPYKKAFFITNQYVKASIRAKLQDELTVKFGFDVRILDRSWILDRVLEGDRKDIAVQELKIGTVILSEKKGVGDIQKKELLDEIELRIRDAMEPPSTAAALVEDAIEAAILSRELEMPRHEIEGRFERAGRVVERYGSPHQKLYWAYQLAWTTFWWHEDYPLFAQRYGAVEKKADGTQNVYELELLSNLWYLLHSSWKAGHLSANDIHFERATKLLKKNLNRLRSEVARPSASLQARSLLLNMQLQEEIISAPQKISESLFQEFESVVRESEGLIGFPFEPLAKIVVELADYIEKVPAFDRLFEAVFEATSRREGEIAGARLLIRRGAKHLESDHPYEAIRVLGRALLGLAKHETRRELVRTLYLCSRAYEQAGLLWAARGALLTAAATAANDLWTYDEVTTEQAVCFNRMKWIELQLGRLPHVLAWHEVDRALRAALASKGLRSESDVEREVIFDASLGILLLRADLWQLTRLSRFPKLLDHLGVNNASVALLFALGYEDETLPEGFRKVAGADLLAFFRRWTDQPATRDLPIVPDLCDQQKLVLKSHILGCEVELRTPNESPYLELSETILSVLEAMMATGFSNSIGAREPRIAIHVVRAELPDFPFEFTFDNAGDCLKLEVRCRSFAIFELSREKQVEVKDRILELMASVIAMAFFIPSMKEMEAIFRDDVALNRALDFSAGMGAVRNVLGLESKITLKSWEDQDWPEYRLIRNARWDDNEPPNHASPEFDNRDGGRGLSEKGNVDYERIKHTDIKTVSLIREELWEEAKWKGVGYFTFPDDSIPPVLALIFQNQPPAAKIFENWRAILGKQDGDDTLRVVVIRGINRACPSHYRVIVTGNQGKLSEGRRASYGLIVSRLLTMEASSDTNWERFMKDYERFGGYWLGYSIMPKTGDEPKLLYDSFIAKTQLHIREAWTVGINELEAVGILPDDAPIIPVGKTKAPVQGVLDRFKQKHGGGRGAPMF